MQPPSTQLSRKSFHGKAGEVRVLDDLSFHINERDFVSIIGPSGCGKTTIFNIIAGLLEPDSGSMHYRGEEIESLRGRVGYMMQKDRCFHGAPCSATSCLASRPAASIAMKLKTRR